ncbi:MAG: nuclear transport factor 2 family protein, partial [Phyllobacterium sp.]
MLEDSPHQKIDTVLQKLEQAFAGGDIAAAVNLFQEDCYWRDLVTLTWNLRTMEGHDQIREMLQAQLTTIKPNDFRQDLNETATEDDGVVQGWIEFETKTARGYGHIRLKNGLIWTLLTTMYELKGYEEPRGFMRPMGAQHGSDPHRKSWSEKRAQEEAELGHSIQPYCVIVGGGQGGIALGARLRQLGVPTIIIERNERPGDSWRKRYKSLCLHDPVWYDHLPYIPFPDNWPVFAPKDKIGDWLEMYTKVMELNYWSSTTCKSATFDDAGGEWTIIVEREGQEVVLRPKQL